LVLTVDIKDFAAAVKEWASVKDVFLSSSAKGSVLTAANPQKNILIVCKTEEDPRTLEEMLAKSGLSISAGKWGESGAQNGAADLQGSYIVGIAYQSRDQSPGLWMDAFATMPTPQIAIRAMYDEFRANNEVGNVSYEEFLKLAHPNVVILSPSEIATYLQSKEEC
jgi:hypothetical protein